MINSPNTSFEFEEPVPCEATVSLDALLAEICGAITTHVVLNPDACVPLALWVVHTYLFRERDADAYVSIESTEKRCGKTTLLSVLAGLSSRPIVASNISTGALFRAISQSSPTLLIDEADTFLGSNSAMRGVLNCGNTWRTAYVVRLEGAGAVKTKGPLVIEGVEISEEHMTHEQRMERQPATGLVRYSCWCPKVIAMIGKIPDTIADRSILVKMRRKQADEKVLPLTSFAPSEITAKCARFAEDNREAVHEAEREIIAGLNDRAADTYEPLAVLARIAGGDWLEKLKASAINLSADITQDEPGAAILLEIAAIFVSQRGKRIFSKDLAAKLSGEQGWVPRNFFDGGAVTEISVARTLAAYGVRPAPVRIGDEVGRGYKLEDLKGALSTYVTPGDLDKRLDDIEAAEEMRRDAGYVGNLTKEQERERVLKLFREHGVPTDTLSTGEPMSAGTDVQQAKAIAEAAIILAKTESES